MNKERVGLLVAFFNVIGGGLLLFSGLWLCLYTLNEIIGAAIMISGTLIITIGFIIIVIERLDEIIKVLKSKDV